MSKYRIREEVNIEDFPKLSMHNMKAIEEAKWCSCYFCFGVFEAETIDWFVDDGVNQVRLSVHTVVWILWFPS